MPLVKFSRFPLKIIFSTIFFVLDPAGRGCADGGGEEGHHAEEGGRGVDGDQRDIQVFFYFFISLK